MRESVKKRVFFRRWCKTVLDVLLRMLQVLLCPLEVLLQVVAGLSLLLRLAAEGFVLHLQAAHL